MEDQLTRKQLLYRENAEKRFRQQYKDFYNNNKEQVAVSTNCVLEI